LSVSIDLPFGLSDLDKIFAVTDLLENRDMLIKEFQPEVSKLLVKKGFFKGPFLTSYQKAFDELIVTLIRREFIKHFPTFTPEEIVLLSDVDFLKMVTNDFYFTQSNYLPRKGEDNDEQTNPIQ
jgi:hypothetical protein